jgi:hypothetical protein
METNLISAYDLCKLIEQGQIIEVSYNNCYSSRKFSKCWEFLQVHNREEFHHGKKLFFNRETFSTNYFCAKNEIWATIEGAILD